MPLLRKNKIKPVLKKVGCISFRLLSTAILIGSISAPAVALDQVETSKNVLASEGGKEALIQALTMAKSKPALSVATGIVCLACVPAAGAVASASMCVACGILIVKTVG